jgi:hypothetical protein
MKPLTDYGGWHRPDGTWDSRQQADIERYVREVEPLLRRGATVTLDGRRPVGELADVVEQLIIATPGMADPRPDW